MRRNRHAIVVLNLPVPDDRRVWAQAKAARASGIDVTVLCPAMRGHRPGRREIEGITVRYLRTIEGRGLIGVVGEGVWNTALCIGWLPWLLVRRIRSLQVCNPPDTLFPLLAAARLAGIRTVYDQHDVAPAMASARPGFARLRPLLELCERLTVRLATVVMTTSVEQQRRLDDRFGVPAVLVRSAPHAPEHAAPPSRDGTRTRLGYVGVVGEQEGLEDLFEAVALLGGRGVDLTVAVAGDGPYLADARARAAALGLDDVVEFAGWLQGDDLESFLDGLDAMVIADPSSEYNHFCAMNKVIEAMARALPVVMRPLRENLNLTGGDGWVADGWSLDAFADAIAAFASAPRAEREAAGASLLQRYRSETAWSLQVPRYIDALCGSMS
jgi:glycosyltransferase involved in cell wall biosynthesis